MAFFKRKFSTLVNVEDVYIAKTTITSSYNDGTGLGPRCVTWYFLVRLKNNGYHELFAGKRLEKVEDSQQENNMVFEVFDIPYIQEVEPLMKYLKDESQKKISLQLLFDFINNMNVLNSFGAFKKLQENK